jgi:hypothetical protein
MARVAGLICSDPEDGENTALCHAAGISYPRCNPIGLFPSVNPKDWQIHIHQSASPKAFDPPAAVSDLAVRAAAALDLDIALVVLLLSIKTQDWIVLEVNPCPESTGLSSVSDVDYPGEIAAYFVEKFDDGGFKGRLSRALPARCKDWRERAMNRDQYLTTDETLANVIAASLMETKLMIDAIRKNSNRLAERKASTPEPIPMPRLSKTDTSELAHPTAPASMLSTVLVAAFRASCPLLIMTFMT